MAFDEVARYTTATSSVLLRFLAYVFLRWVNNALTFAPEHLALVQSR
jgi:hypothetical protein